MKMTHKPQWFLSKLSGFFGKDNSKISSKVSKKTFYRGKVEFYRYGNSIVKREIDRELFYRFDSGKWIPCPRLLSGFIDAAIDFKFLAESEDEVRKIGEEARRVALCNLMDLAADASSIALGLPEWIRKSRRTPFMELPHSLWDEIIKICDKSQAAAKNCSFETPDEQSVVQVCHSTGFTTYRCGLYEYIDSSINHRFTDVKAIGKIEKFGWTELCASLTPGYVGRMHSFEREAYFITRRIIGSCYEKLVRHRKESMAQVFEHTAKQPGSNLEFLKYAASGCRNEELPKEIGVVFPGDSAMPHDPHFDHGGSFAIVVYYNGAPAEIHECDEKGTSIYRTYLSGFPH
jgi:hypothetical protein